MRSRIIFIVGPTASGKSEVAVYLAKLAAGEIISCDSMQIYKGMDIITSKPEKKLRKRIRHHLLDILSPEKEYNVARFRREAVRAVRDIIARGKVPIFCGGTGLYMTMLLDGIFQGSYQDERVRKDLYAKAEKYGKSYLYRRLKRRDPQAAEKIHPNDLRRIVRALEVLKTAGKPISELQQQRKGLAAEYDVRIFCLNPDRELLYRKIDERVKKMFKRGLVREVKKLLALRLSRTAKAAIGIRELEAYFDGTVTLDDAGEAMARSTRQYAKRQLTWFRKDKRIDWISIGKREKSAAVAMRIWKKLF